MENQETCWTICPECKGSGKKKQRLRKKVKLRYQSEFAEFKKNKDKGTAPIKPKAHLKICVNCYGSGLIPAASHPRADSENYPHLAIIGGGIGGVALAVACLHRGIPFTLYERDSSFDARSQGYGLTLQQAHKAIEGLGIFSLEEGVISTRHLVHTTEGKVIGEWGMRKWLLSVENTSPKRRNVHIARQSLRLALLKQLDGSDGVQWDHQLIDLKKCNDKSVELKFEVNGKIKRANTDLVVGADGIRSSVRHLLLGKKSPPLHYLGCIVILGICSLKNLDDVESSLLDSGTVFQTANGYERIYVMPYSLTKVMWQLSFPLPEKEAKALSAEGAIALKKEACKRTQWHSPIPEILNATDEAHISGYPVYDRELLTPELFKKMGPVTLIGDAAHPMSPFKGQGANQALLDALALARGVSIGCNLQSNWRKNGLRESVLTEFEAEMISRSSSKVKDSAAAVQFLHSEIVLHEGDQPRGRCLQQQ